MTTTTFHLTIDTDNDAFVPDPSEEIARILRHEADRVALGLGGVDNRILDLNGNTVGSWSLEESGW